MLLFPRWKALNAQKAVEKAFEIFAKKHSWRTINFLQYHFTAVGGFAIVADDSDPAGKGTQYGFHRYESLRLCWFNGRPWMVGLGTSHNRPAARRFVNDIVAYPTNIAEDRLTGDLNPQAVYDISQELREKNHFHDSSIAVVSVEGMLLTRNEPLKSRLNRSLSEFELSREEQFGIIIGSGGKRVSRGYVSTYRRDFPKFLAQAMYEHILWQPV